jgi:hypothetical protein
MKMSMRFALLSIASLFIVSSVGCGSGKESDTSVSPTASTSTGTAQFSESVPEPLVKLQNLVVAGGKCNMESINGTGWATQPPFVAQQKDTVSIVGWGVDDQAKRLPTAIFLRFQQGQREFYAPIQTRTNRTDLVEYFKEDYYKEAGYRADASLANLPPGEYQAMIVMTFPDKAILCAAGRTIKIN